MLLEKLHTMTYAMQHGSYKEFEDARTELTIACRDADEKLAAFQQSVHPTVATVAPPEVESTTRNSG